MQNFFVITIFVPDDHVKTVLEACFLEGAGQLGHYRDCCWLTHGEGRFQPTQGAKPSYGRCFEPSKVPEVRIEMMCAAARWPSVEVALRAAHPYETPVYYVMPMLNNPLGAALS